MHQKILVVEDNKFNVIFLEEMLKSQQHEVFVANDGYAALEMAKNSDYDLILLDIMMPGIDGFETCKQLKDIPNYVDVPVIFLTALTDKDHVIKGLEVGGVDYITKPFNEKELLARINTHLALKKAQSEMSSVNNKLLQEIETRKIIEEKLKTKSFEVVKANNELRKSYEQISIINKQLKENEAKFRLISETSIDPIFQLSEEGHFIYVSNAIKTLLGYNPKELEGQSIACILTEDDKDIFKRNIHFNKCSESQQLVEVPLLSKESKAVECEINICQRNLNGDGVVIQGIIRDVSERKELENKLISSIIETEEFEKTHFARELHDGLGASLSSISLYIDMVLNTDLDHQEKKDIMHELKELINQTVGKAKSLSNSLRSNILNNFGLYEAISSFCQETMDMHPVIIRLELPENRARLCKNMETLMYRCFTELVSNTISHAQAKTIEAKFSLSPQKSIALAYKDDGVGFDFDKVMARNADYAGLKRMIHRINFVKGKYTINTQPGKGFETSISFSFNNMCKA